MTTDELERPCFICANARKTYVNTHWVTMARIEHADEWCGHREPELRALRYIARRVSVARETVSGTFSSSHVA